MMIARDLWVSHLISLNGGNDSIFLARMEFQYVPPILQYSLSLEYFGFFLNSKQEWSQDMISMGSIYRDKALHT